MAPSVSVAYNCPCTSLSRIIHRMFSGVARGGEWFHVSIGYIFPCAVLSCLHSQDVPLSYRCGICLARCSGVVLYSVGWGVRFVASSGSTSCARSSYFIFPWANLFSINSGRAAIPLGRRTSLSHGLSYGPSVQGGTFCTRPSYFMIPWDKVWSVGSGGAHFAPGRHTLSSHGLSYGPSVQGGGAHSVLGRHTLSSHGLIYAPSVQEAGVVLRHSISCHVDHGLIHVFF